MALFHFRPIRKGTQMRNIILLFVLALGTQTSFASSGDEVMNFLNEGQELNLSIPAESSIANVQIIVFDKSSPKSKDTINNNLLDMNGRPTVGFVGMTPYEAVREDNQAYDREGSGSTVCDVPHQKLINGELNRKDVSDFACHSVVASAIGVTVSNAIYKHMRGNGNNQGLSKGVSYLSGALAGIATLSLKEKVYDVVYETADIGTGMVPLYESENGFGLYYIGDLGARKSIYMVVHFQ
jgi:hypothetical protein